MQRLAYGARLLLAALGVFLAILVLVGLLGPYLEGPWGAPLGFALALAPVALCFGAFRLLGTRARLPLAPASGRLLASTAYAVRRAFRVEPFEDEGPGWFLELGDRRVLFLVGQHLAEHEPAAGRPRRFPCTELTVHRDPADGTVVEISCGGAVLEPELVAPPFGADADVPEDGALLATRYEPLRDAHRRRCA